MFDFDKVKRNAAGVPFVVLAGREYPIPPLSIGKLRVIVPALASFGAYAARAMDSDGKIDNLAAMSFIDEEVMDKIIRAVHAAVSQTTRISLDEFLSLVITPNELFEAIPAVAMQTGMLKPKESASVGEAQAQAAE